MSRIPVHPGKILKDELEELQIFGAVLAREIYVPANRINSIMAGKRNITADTALRLGKWFGMSASFWLNLQKNYELRLAEKNISKDIDKIETRNRENILV
jgi:antitoxin HigA-1